MSRVRPSTPALISVFAFGALSLLGGWLIVYGGGFFHAPGKHSSEAVFVSGAPAVFMACLQYLAAALSFTWLLRLYVSATRAGVLAFVAVFGPPVLYLCAS